MQQKISDYITSSNNNEIQEVISYPVPLFKSIRGKYFVGQTETLWVGNRLNAWAGLVNPPSSNVNLFTNVFTISNFSDNYLTAEIWLNTTLPKNISVSHKVSPTNTALTPLPQNKVEIQFLEYTDILPENGVNVYERIVPPNTTLVGEEDGKFIEAPGGDYVIVIKSSSSNINKVIVAFGWWESSIWGPVKNFV